MTLKELFEKTKDLDENLDVIRLDNSLGYEKINSARVIEVQDNFSHETKMAIVLE